ncbi:hypothetical protein [Nonomuraea soli]|uniref:Membrane protein YdbS with pleckstrin-like domain n=1 Tax=Nonomuraea soli TaxID=1032476 RepID=A0A7W0HVX9_9ACTN|nr:hypothetical protein [Nonomuraea soli]MBA2897266.1 membrane protein YdbS with pleckstrin-like domain [Nonomuraea soli]
MRNILSWLLLFAAAALTVAGAVLGWLYLAVRWAMAVSVVALLAFAAVVLIGAMKGSRGS